MNTFDQANTKPLKLRSWVLWLSGAALVTAVWAFVDNVNDHEWVLAGAFGAVTLGLIIQIIGLFWIRRRPNRRPEEGDAREHRQ